jgi:hypothetical protein
MVIDEWRLQPDGTREQCTKKCTICWYWTNGTYRDMCLDSLWISEREDLIQKVRELITSISRSFEKDCPWVLNHFINNLLCSYLALAIELQVECHGRCPKDQEHTLHELHKLVYKIYHLLEFWESEQKIIFCNRLIDSFHSRNFWAMSEIWKALDAARESYDKPDDELK